MPLNVVVGAQFGGEGKGKIVSHLSIADDVDYVVRCGGPNSGHTVDYRGFRVGLRMLPAGFVNENTKLMLAAGSLINPRILFQEMEHCKVDRSRLIIDRNACMISDGYSKEELELGLRSRIGSTASGTGIGVAKRALREPEVKLAKDLQALDPYIDNVSEKLNSALDENRKVIIEGTQGFGLSLYHSPNYPYCTSRDTTVAGFLSETGLAPSLVDNVIMAIRTFPIRVEGDSGPLAKETDWETVRQSSGYPYPISEQTTATGRTRRVGEFDMDIVRVAARVNRPSQLALHGADYLGFENKGLVSYSNLSNRALDTVNLLEKSLRVPVTFIGTGPRNEEIIQRRMDAQGWPLEKALPIPTM